MYKTKRDWLRGILRLLRRLSLIVLMMKCSRLARSLTKSSIDRMESVMGSPLDVSSLISGVSCYLSMQNGSEVRV